MVSVPSGAVASLVSPDEGWAEQQVGSASTVHFLHYQQGTWTDVMQVPGAVQDIKMLSPQEGWAIVRPTSASGPTGSTPSPYYHFTGRIWQQVTLPDPQDLQGAYVFPTAPDAAWFAAEGFSNKTVFVTHGQAQMLPLPQPFTRTVQITGDGEGGVWALVYVGSQPQSAILYDVRGAWTIYGLGA